MREILFRGKTKETHEWVYGGYCKMDDRHFIVKTITYPIDNTCSWGVYEVDPATVGQFIGLHDMDGNMIFEGDIVQCYYSWSNELSPCKSLVEYGVFNCSCCGGVYGWEFDNDDIREYQNYKVTGNIFDDKE